jgi:hypothetical protein
MNGTHLDICHTGVLRQKRRPPLACLQCRRRKIKYVERGKQDTLLMCLLMSQLCRCDRGRPCQPCSKATDGACIYVCDRRRSFSAAPFDAQETQFTVFQQLPMVSEQPAAWTTTIESPERFGSDHGFSDLPNFCDQDSSSRSWESDGLIGFDLSLNKTMEQPNPLHGSTPPCTSDTDTTAASFVRDLFFKKSSYGQSHWMHFLHIVGQSLSGIEAI